MSRGKLIVLEGLDGAGTTTQTKRLVAHLAASSGAPAVNATRQPSDGPIGRLIREMLGGGHALPAGGAIDQATFSLLFAADRVDHLQREVVPVLERGGLVVSDRWYHSSFAYQGTGAEQTWIKTLNERAIAPDLTVFLRVAPEVAADRRVRAGRVDELFEDLPMQQRVSAGYEATLIALAERGERIVILDGEQAPDAVFAGILHAVADLGIAI